MESERGCYPVEDIIINVNTLPETLYRRIRGDRVRVREADGIISLIPVEAAVQSDTPLTDSLIGILKNSGIKSVNDIRDMRLGL